MPTSPLLKRRTAFLFSLLRAIVLAYMQSCMVCPCIMSISKEIAAIEAQLRGHGIAVQEFLRRVPLDLSTWNRWKAGRFRPRFEKWQAVQQALKQIQTTQAAE